MATPSAEGSEVVLGLRDLHEPVQSNLLELETKELLAQSALGFDGPSVAACTKKLQALTALLKNLKPRPRVVAKSLPRGTPQWTCEPGKPVSLDFVPPSSFFVAGSFALRTMTKGKRCVDLCVEMPTACLDKRDYLNKRYANKRALFLAVLAECAESTPELVSDVSWSFFQGDHSKPVVQLKLARGNAANKELAFTVRLIPTLADDAFPLVRFLPTKNNVRRRETLAALHGGAITEVNIEDEPETSMYNMGVLEDIKSVSFSAHADMLFDMCQVCEGLPGAMVLVKAWMRQRHLARAGDSDVMNEFLVCALMAHLLNTNVLKRHMQSLPLFRALVSYLASTDLSSASTKNKSKVIRFKARDNVDFGESDERPVGAGISDDVWRAHFPLAIISSCGRFNLAFRVSDSAYQALRNEAKLALDSLMQATHGGRDVFESLFCTKLNFWCSYDHFFAVRLPALAAVEEKLLGADIERSICDLTWPHVVRDIAQELVTRGLVSTERAKLVRVCLPDVGQWKSSAAVPEPDHLVVCVTLDSDNALRLVDRGPDAADDKLCRDFRTLWGTRAELRRFQDGSIVESVVWTDENGKTDKPRIPFLVVNHLLTTHNPFCGPQGLAAPRDSVWTVQGPLEKYMTRVLSERFLPAWATSESSTGTDDAMSRFRSAIATFHDVDTHLRELNLPLDINAVEPADPALRYSSVVPPVAHPLAFGSKDKSKFTIAQQQRRGGGGRKRQRPGVPSSSSWVSRILRPMEVVVQLENSARWPDNIEAINHMKVAFYVQMAEQLEQRSRGMTRCQVGTDALDVMQSGFVFRVRIRHYREVDLLAGKVQAGSLALAATRTKLSARQLEVNRGEAFRLKQMTELRPVLHSKLHGLYLRAEVAQSMSTVVRLAKLWISGHHMSAHIEEHAIELLVSCLYVHSAPFEAPRSAACGFLRFLHLLATWSWADAPLVVDINGDLTAEDTTAISTAFFQHKDAGRACPMHLIVPENRASSWLPSWTTKTCPSAGALDRVVVSARDSLKLLSGLFDANCRGGIADDDVLWRAVFRSPVNKSSGFDAVVSLDPVALVGLTSSSPASTSSNGVGKTGDEWNVALYKNLAVAAEDSVLVGFDPLARYAQDLRHEFGSLAEFFYDGLQGQEIGVQWRKDAARPVALRVGSSMYAKKASVKDGDKEGEEKVVPNYAQITHTMREMGSGVVSDVQVWGVPTATTESPVSKRSKKRKIKTGDEKNRLSASNSNSKRTKSAL